MQGLATEVRAAAYTNIEDVVAFVDWLDDELSFLVRDSMYQVPPFDMHHFDSCLTYWCLNGTMCLTLIQVDERAVLKHFDWPEGKADALREASFEYQDLQKLVTELTGFEDDVRVPYDSSLKKMLACLEK